MDDAKPRIATLTSTAVHLFLTVASHPYLKVSFSDCARFVVMTLTSTSRQQEWRPFVQHVDIRMTSLEGEGNEHRPYQRAEILKSDAASNITNDRVPFVTTFHPMNLVAEKIISRKFRTFREDSTTRNIFHKPPLKAFRRAKNLKDLLHRSSLLRNLPQQPPGTLPCNRTVCRTCPHVNSSSTITTPKRHVNIAEHFSCITEHMVYCLSCTKCPSTVYVGETRRRLADRF